MLRFGTRVSSPAGKCESLSNATCSEVCKGSGTIIELVPTPPGEPLFDSSQIFPHAKEWPSWSANDQGLCADSKMWLPFLCIWLVWEIGKVLWTNCRAFLSKANATPDYLPHCIENYFMILMSWHLKLHVQTFNICSYILQLSYIRNLIARCCGLIFSSIYNTPKQMLVKFFTHFYVLMKENLLYAIKSIVNLLRLSWSI